MRRTVAIVADPAPEIEFKPLGEVAGYSDSRVGAELLDKTSFVGVDNLLSNGRGRTDASYAPNTTALCGFRDGDVLLGNIRPYLRKLWLADRAGGCSGDVLAIRLRSPYESEILPGFLYYVLSTDSFFTHVMRHARGAKMPRGDKEAILRYRVPIPDIHVQRTIVATLDSLVLLETELRAALETEREARMRQYDYYRRRLLSLDSNQAAVDDRPALASLVSFTNGKPHERFVVDDGSVTLITPRFVSTSGESARYTDPEHALSPATAGDIAMVMSDLPNGKALARCYHVPDGRRYSANQRVCLLRVVDTEALDARYLFHFLDRNPQLLRYDNGQYQTHLRKNDILSVRVPPMPISEQRGIAQVLDRFSVVVDELSARLAAELQARRVQYEHYRDRLLTFKPAAA